MSTFDFIKPPVSLGRQSHGLWSTGYHLIHPRGLSFKNDVFVTDQIESVEDAAENTEDLFIWETPNNPKRLESGTRIGAGITWEPECSGEVGCWGSCNEGEVAITDGVCDDAEVYFPSNISAIYKDSTFGFAANDYAEKVLRILERKREYELERRFWYGDCLHESGDPNTPVNMSLAGPTGLSGVQTITTPATPSPAQGFMALEKARRKITSDIGVIHAPLDVIANVAATGLIEKKTMDLGDGMGARSVLVTTIGGNLVVAGAGYDDDPANSGPAGASPGNSESYIYMTSMVNIIWDTPVLNNNQEDFSTAIQGRNNDVVIGASQLIGAFPTHPCQTVAILVDNSLIV